MAPKGNQPRNQPRNQQRNKEIHNKLKQEPQIKYVGPNFLNMKPPAGYIAGVGRGATPINTRADLGPFGSTPNDKKFEDAQDEAGLLSTISTSKLDEHKAYIEVENRMKRRHSKIEPETDSTKLDELKQGLKSVTEEEWSSIPEVLDMTFRNKRIRASIADQKRDYAVPESVVLAEMEKEQLEASIEPSTRGLADTLDSVAHGVETETNISQYIKKLQSDKIALENAERAHESLQQLVKLQPHDPQAWIQLARVEEKTNRHKRAKHTIEKATKFCSTSQDVWLESIRLHSNAQAKDVAAKAVKVLPNSIEIWKAKAELEHQQDKLLVIQDALEANPGSAELWAMAASLEEVESVKKDIIRTATELVSGPDSVDLWVMLLDLEDNESVLDKAIESVGPCRQRQRLWVKRFILEHKKNGKLAPLIETAMTSEPDISAQDWLDSVLDCGDYKLVARSIVKGLHSTETDLQSVLVQKNYPIARLLFEELVETKAALFHDWVKMEEEDPMGDRVPVLEQAVWALKDFDLFLKLLESCDSVETRRDSCKLAIESFDLSEKVYREICRVLLDMDCHEDAKPLLDTAIAEFGTRDIYLLSIKAYWGDPKALTICREALEKYPSEGTFHVATWRLEPSDLKKLVRATRNARKCESLWLEIAREETTKSVARARLMLAQAATHIPNSARIWSTRALLEKNHGSHSSWTNMIAQGLQACPNAGPLLLQQFASMPRVQRRFQIELALKKSPRSPYLLLALSLDCESKGFHEEAIEYAEEASTLSRSGDVWIWLYKLQPQTILERARLAGLEEGLYFDGFGRVSERLEAKFENIFD